MTACDDGASPCSWYRKDNTGRVSTTSYRYVVGHTISYVLPTECMAICEADEKCHGLIVVRGNDSAPTCFYRGGASAPPEALRAQRVDRSGAVLFVLDGRHGTVEAWLLTYLPMFFGGVLVISLCGARLRKR